MALIPDLGMMKNAVTDLKEILASANDALQKTMTGINQALSNQEVIYKELVAQRELLQKLSATENDNGARNETRDGNDNGNSGSAARYTGDGV